MEEGQRMSSLDLRELVPAPVSRSTPNGGGNHGATISVLIVEDETIEAEALGKYVARVPGFVVSGTAGSGAEALRRLALERIGLVLLDIYLPDINGIEVVRAMRTSGYTSDVIVVTRRRDSQVVRAAAAYGIVHYLVKPFTFAVLSERLERYRAYHDQLSALQPFFTQADIDRILTAVHLPGPTDVAKGMSRESLDAVVAIVRAVERSGLGAAEVAAALGASRITARKYLEYLVELGLVLRRPRYGGAHRPEVEYWWRAAQTEDDGDRNRVGPTSRQCCLANDLLPVDGAVENRQLHRAN
jgi:response regulator of citrate/malate metabolism